MNKLFTMGLFATSLGSSMAFACGDSGLQTNPNYYETVVETCYLFPEINMDNANEVSNRPDTVDMQYPYRIRKKVKLFTRDNEGKPVIQDFEKITIEKFWVQATNLAKGKKQLESFIRSYQDMRCK